MVLRDRLAGGYDGLIAQRVGVLRGLAELGLQQIGQVGGGLNRTLGLRLLLPVHLLPAQPAILGPALGRAHRSSGTVLAPQLGDAVAQVGLQLGDLLGGLLLDPLQGLAALVLVHLVDDVLGEVEDLLQVARRDVQ